MEMDSCCFFKILNETKKQTQLRKPPVSLRNYGLDNVGYVFQWFSLFIGDKPAFSTKKFADRC